jgi:hypothetical protein
MNYFLPIFCWLLPAIALPQTKNNLQKVSDSILGQTQGKTIINNKVVTNTRTSTPYKPEILTSGFIDIINNGQVNASARFIRLMIGETDKFVLLVRPGKKRLKMFFS